MRRCILIGLCTLCIWLMASEGVAQTVIRSTGDLVLFLPNNGRTAALSEAGVGLIGSGQAILYNPSGLAFMEGREAYFTYVDWISGSKNYIAGISANVPGKGTFGLSMEYTYLYRAAGYSLGVSLRGGRRSRGSWSSANPITWGGGLQFKTTGGRGVKVDYARRSFNYRIEDPRVHILSVVFNF